MFEKFIDWLVSKSPRHKALQSDLARTTAIMVTYAGALREIHTTTSAVKVPNGTTKKVLRVSAAAFDTASKTF